MILIGIPLDNCDQVLPKVNLPGLESFGIKSSLNLPFEVDILNCRSIECDTFESLNSINELQVGVPVESNSSDQVSLGLYSEFDSLSCQVLDPPYESDSFGIVSDPCSDEFVSASTIILLLSLISLCLDPQVFVFASIYW